MRIDRRYNGPPDSAHGGVACGIFAGAIDSRAAVVRLLQPPPLDQEFDVEIDGDTAVIGSGGVSIAQVRPLTTPTTDLADGPMGWIPDEELDGARRQWVDEVQPDHLFPTCFGCGHGRPDGDGLELFAGTVPGTDVAAAAWTPDSSLGEDGVVADWAVWAAVDCPSGGAVISLLEESSAMLLGELAVRINQSPIVGTRYQVIAQPRGRDGRRLVSDVFVVDEAGGQLAHGWATWIALDQIPQTSHG